MLRRGLLLALSVIVLAWLGVGLRDMYYLNHGSHGNLHMLITDVQTHSGFDHLRGDLHKAQFLNPDTAPQLSLAADYILLAAIPRISARAIRDDGDHALRIAEAVVRKEPQNVLAWIRVLQAQMARHDLGGEQAAAARIGQLDPISLKRS